MRSLKRPFLAIALLGALAQFGTPSRAHSPQITGYAECDASTNSLVLYYTASAWVATSDGSNSDVRVYVNGVQVDSGVFEDPDYSFSGSIAAPPGDSAHLGVQVFGTWGSGVEGGQTSHITVYYPEEECGPPEGEGRFTGGGFQVKVGVARITRGLTIHCDLELSNNLEVNWLGNQFHMTEHLETVSCTDSPDIIQAPPAAPLDTLIGVGTGRYNGVDGYTIEFTLVDAGEPGTNDQAAIRIYQTSTGTVVLNVTLQTLAGGNLQAHYDQPHQ